MFPSSRDLNIWTSKYRHRQFLSFYFFSFWGIYFFFVPLRLEPWGFEASFILQNVSNFKEVGSVHFSWHALKYFSNLARKLFLCRWEAVWAEDTFIPQTLTKTITRERKAPWHKQAVHSPNDWQKFLQLHPLLSEVCEVSNSYSWEAALGCLGFLFL